VPCEDGLEQGNQGGNFIFNFQFFDFF